MTTEQIAGEIEGVINFHLTRKCDHASVRRALNFPASGRAVVARIRGAYWAGTEQSEHCIRLGKSLEGARGKLASLGLK